MAAGPTVATVVRKPTVPEEFTTALRVAMGDAGLSIRALGDLCKDHPVLGRGKDTVSLWVRGVQPMWPDEVFALEQLLGVGSGTLSRALGYVPADSVSVASVVDAIEADSSLRRDQREMLRGAYEAVRRQR